MERVVKKVEFSVACGRTFSLRQQEGADDFASMQTQTLLIRGKSVKT